jgi:hypothetical protein
VNSSSAAVGGRAREPLPIVRACRPSCTQQRQRQVWVSRRFGRWSLSLVVRRASSTLRPACVGRVAPEIQGSAICKGESSSARWPSLARCCS